MPKGNVRESNVSDTVSAKLNLVSLNPFCDTVTNGTVTLMQYSPRAWTISNLYAKTSSGTCDLEVQIDGVAVTGLSGVSASSTETSATATANYTVAAGATVTLVVSSNADALDLAVTLNGAFT